VRADAQRARPHGPAATLAAGPLSFRRRGSGSSLRKRTAPPWQLPR